MTRRDDAHEWTNGKMHERYESRVVEHTAALREQKALAKFLALFSHVAVNFPSDDDSTSQRDAGRVMPPRARAIPHPKTESDPFDLADVASALQVRARALVFSSSTVRATTRLDD